MSREIKFRIWRAPDEYTKVSWMESWDSLLNYSMSDIFQLDNPDDVLEQFTGLKDKDGKDIYEGDIVHGYDQEPDRDDGYIGSSVIEVVNFKWGSFWLGDFKNQIMLYTPPIIEVVGNVHMNPELLEG